MPKCRRDLQRRLHNGGESTFPGAFSMINPSQIQVIKLPINYSLDAMSTGKKLKEEGGGGGGGNNYFDESIEVQPRFKKI